MLCSREVGIPVVTIAMSLYACFLYLTFSVSLVPRPRPAFRRLHLRKSGSGPVIFSHVSDVRLERVVERV